MDSLLSQVLASDELWKAAIALVAAFWGSAKAWAYRVELKSQAAKDARELAIHALEVGVHDAWERRGKQLKHAKKAPTEPKLSEEEKAQLRSMALDTAKAFAIDRGIDPTKILGSSVDLVIKQIIDARKAGQSHRGAA